MKERLLGLTPQEKYHYSNYLKCRDATRRRMEAHRDFIDAMKDEPCMDCGGSFPPCAMDYDHVRGEKKGELKRLYMRKIEAVLEEIAKCDLVCANCHRIRTHIKRGRPWVRRGEQSSMEVIVQRDKARMLHNRNNSRIRKRLVKRLRGLRG